MSLSAGWHTGLRLFIYGFEWWWGSPIAIVSVFAKLEIVDTMTVASCDQFT